MATPNAVRGALRANNIAGLLEYKPGPGIYSRLERAVQQLPETVRVSELPGLLKRYKEGIPGWELDAVQLGAVTDGRTIVRRDELLDAVRQFSPVFTHKEVVLGGKPQSVFEPDFYSGQQPSQGGTFVPVHQNTPSAIGEGVSHGYPRYAEYGQGGKDYSEVLLLQPNARGDLVDPHHWKDSPVGAFHDPKWRDGESVVAHLRHDTHGDALRINEVQSDVGIHNRKIREVLNSPQVTASYPDGTTYATDDMGIERQVDRTQPFPLEDAWADILTKRAVLEAARQGHRAIEIASPRAIADTVGGNIDNYNHFYGKVVPGAIERLGRKMGGLREELISELSPRSVAEAAEDRLWNTTPEGFAAKRAFMEMERIRADLSARYPSGSDYGRRGIGETVERIVMRAPWMSEIRTSDAIEVRDVLWNDLERQGYAEDVARQMADKEAGTVVREMQRMQDLARMEHETTRAIEAKAAAEGAGRPRPSAPAGRRYVMSDEMRRRIINEGIPAAIAVGVGTGLATGGNQAEAKPVLPESDAVLRAAMPWQTQRKINRLTKQVDAAYEQGDFKTAEKLDAQREQLVEEWDNKLEGLDEGDGNVDFEPEPYDEDSAWTDELANIYGRAAVAQSPTYGIGNDAELAQALRGVFPDTAKANAIPDAEIIQYAKDAFDQRQAHLATVRSRSPEDGVRSMQAQMRGAGIAPAVAAGLQGPQSQDQTGGYKFDAIKAFNELPRGRVDLGPHGFGNPDRSFDFSMANSPGEWATYYNKAAKEGFSQEHLQFRKNVAEVMNQPLIRVGAANDSEVQGGTGLLVDGDAQDRITPAQFVNEYLDVFAGKMPPERRAQVVQNVQAKLDGSTRAPDDMADRIVGRMMNSLQASSPGGKHAAVDPMPQEQLEQLKAQHGGWADSMLTPGGAENFQTLRGYELLRSTMDGEHAPVYADTMSNVVAGVKGIFDSKARQNFRDSTMEAGPEGRFIRGNRDYAASGPREGEPAAFRNQDGSSRFAATTTSNVQGMMRAGGDVSNPVGAMSWPLYESFSEFGRTPVGKAVTGEGGSALFSDSGWDAWRHMAAKRQAFDREQPILPAGMSREEFDRQRADHQQDRAEGQAWGATTWPNVQNAFEQTGLMFSPQAWGGGDAPAPEPVKKTWGPPLYNDYGPNFLPNTVGNIPSAAIMVGAAATGGLGGMASGAFKPSGSTVRSLINSGMGLGKGAVRGTGAAVTSQAKDVPADFGTDMGIGGGIAGWKNYRDYLLTPQEDNALLPGVDPNSMSIDELNQARTNAMDEREKRFRSNQWQWGRQ